MMNSVPRFIKSLLAGSICLSFLVAGCAKEITPSALAEPYDLSEGIAATVNGVDIGECAVTAYIANSREVGGIEDDDSWGEWLIDNGYTIDSLRAEVVDYYVSEELVRQAAEQNGIVVTDDEIDAYISQQEDQDPLSEEDRYYAKQTLLQNKLEVAVASSEPTDEELLSYINEYSEQFGLDKPDDGFTSLSDIPEEILSATKEALAEGILQKHYVEWMASFKDEADIDKNLLPEGVPYDMDLEPYAQAAEEAMSAASDSEEGVDE